jgi:glycosyltransferase involved in cell wall biosynthesis
MRVCHLWDKFLPLYIGGIERYIISLTQFLAKNEKIDFSLVTDRSKFLLFTKKIPKYENTGFLKICRLGPRPIDIINGTLFYSFRKKPAFLNQIRLASLCNEATHWKYAKTADVFHVHGLWDDLDYTNIGMYLSKYYKKPLVLTLHGGFIGDVKRGGMPLENPNIKKFLQNDVAAITTYSQEVLDGLKNLGLGNKSYLVRNFVDTKQFSKPETDNQHDVTLIFVSRLEILQHPELVVQAFKKVNSRYPNAKLHIVGYGSQYEKTKNLIQYLNLQNSVTLFGKQTDVRKFLWSSDIFLASDFGYIATLEAWSAGLSVIAPNFGIMKETIIDGYNGLLFPSQDVNQLAEAIVKLIENKNFRDKLAANGKQTVNEYDIKAVAPKISEIYRSVIKK